MNQRMSVSAVLAAAASVVLMAFSATASATVITSPSGTLYTSSIHAESEGHVVFHAAGGKVECNSTIAWGIQAHGSSITATGAISTLTFTGCTNGWTMTVLKTGSIEIHTFGSNSDGGGTVTSTGTEFTMHNSFLGLDCIYTTNANDFGTLTGGKPATIHVNGVIARTGGSVFCGTSTTWTGSYKIPKPSELLVD
ncbi:MAG TPA: hypothetical protein VIL21_01715 [Solirubrobacterales bacterium]|jgi:hypothetical protein